MSENYQYAECKHCGQSVMENQIHGCKKMYLAEIEALRTDVKTLATAVMTANYHNGIIYNFGGAAAAITIESAAEIARKYAE